jgi:hypothetical protein
MAEVKIKLGETDLTVKPLTLRDLRQLASAGHLKVLSNLTAELTPEHIDAMLAVITASVQRTHKQVDAEWLLDNVEQQDLAHLFQVCADVAGFLKRADSPNAASP